MDLETYIIIEKINECSKITVVKERSKRNETHFKNEATEALGSHRLVLNEEREMCEVCVMTQS